MKSTLPSSPEEYKNPPTPSTTNPREYDNEAVQNTLKIGEFCPPQLKEATERENTLIDQRLRELFPDPNYRPSIADIGCGDGRHGRLFAHMCEKYIGFEISPEMVRQSRKNWEDLNNARVIEGDAGNIEIKDAFDVALCLYFTSGNFRRGDNSDLSIYTDEYLNDNPEFQKIISNFYNALKPNGRMFLTVYKDNETTEDTQRTFYENTGQTVITPLGSRYVATEENFWSVRWTKESMLSNLARCGITEEQVIFHDLNDIAWIVEIIKPGDQYA